MFNIFTLSAILVLLLVLSAILVLLLVIDCYCYAKTPLLERFAAPLPGSGIISYLLSIYRKHH